MKTQTLVLTALAFGAGYLLFRKSQQTTVNNPVTNPTVFSNANATGGAVPAQYHGTNIDINTTATPSTSNANLFAPGINGL